MTSVDLPPDCSALADGAVADLSTAAFFAAAGRHGARAAAVLAIAHDPAGDLDVDGLRAAASALGRVGAAALAIPERTAAPLPPPREDEAA